jgi:phospholipase C
MENIVDVMARQESSRRLKPGNFLEIPVVAQAGQIIASIDLVGVGPNVKVPGALKTGPNGEPMDDPDAVQKEINVTVDILDPITHKPAVTRTINNKRKAITNKNTDGTQAKGDLGFTVPDSGAGKTWVVRVTNHGRKGSDVDCHARVRFVKSRHLEETTLIPVRVLNNALRQVIALLSLQVRFDNNLLVVNVSSELVELSGGAVAPLSKKIDLPLTVRDLNLSSLELRASTPGKAAQLNILVQFETEGVEGEVFGIVSADLKEAAIRVDITLANEKSAFGIVRIRPIVTARVSLSGPVTVDFGPFGKKKLVDLREYADQAKSLIEEFAASKDYLDLVGQYVAETFTQLSAHGHRFNGIEASGDNFLIRHYDPAVQAGSTGGVAPPKKPLVVADPTDKLVPKEDPEVLKNLDKIDHIIVLMQENRSFDQVLGYLKAQGGRTDVDGLNGNETNSTLGVANIKVNPLDSSIFRFGPNHGHEPVVAQINDGEMSGFLASFVERFPTVDPDLAMGFHTAKQVPAFDQLVKEFLVCDRWFSSHPGPTQPNRYCTLTGQTPILDNFDFGDPHLGFFPETTIFDLLSEANISWAYYEGDIAFLRMFDKFRLDNKHVIPIDDPKDGFFIKARKGELEQVVFIDPNFADVPPKRSASDDTPPADLFTGQVNIGFIFDNLIASPQWPKSLFVITYDEHGGFYDHVAPPGTKLAKEQIDFVRVHPNGSDFLGVRVPALVISPWVPRGEVSHLVFDHTSIVKTILVKFLGEGARDRMGRRVLRARNLGMLLTNSEVREDKPFVRVVPEPSFKEPGGDLPNQPLLLPDEFHETMRRFGVLRTLAKG